MSPAGRSKHRRDTWPCKQAAHESLRKKPLFASFDPRCFDLYIEHGLVEQGDQATLRIPKSAEVAVFRTNPDHFWYRLKRPDMPVTQLSGRQSLFIKRGFPQKLKRKVGINYELFEGGHMFVLEQPEAVAARIIELAR